MDSKTKRCGTYAVPKLLPYALEVGCLNTEGVIEHVVIPAETPLYFGANGTILALKF